MFVKFIRDPKKYYQSQISDFVFVDMKEHGTKQSRVRLSLNQKVKLIEESMQPGFSQTKAAKEYGISKSSLSKILKNKFAFYCHPEGMSTSKKNLSRGRNDILEQRLYEWYLQRQTAFLPISGPMIKSKAEELSNSHDCSATEGFKFSSGWLDGFLKRHDIKIRK